MSIPSQAALVHLRSIKPNDGWAVQKVNDDNNENKGLRLLRRNVPLSDNHFLDIHYCSLLNLVVGVLTTDGSSCQVLVDKRGSPVAGIRVVSVSTYDPKSAKNINFAQSRSQQNNNATNTATPSYTPRRSAARTSTAQTSLTPQQNQKLLKYALVVVGVCMVAKLLASSSLAGLYLVFLPLAYLYAVQMCPSIESFDAKKELKRVMRGQHLPEDHPDKPRGFFEDLAARVAASVTTELATMPGYEVEVTNFGNAAWLAHVRVPTAKIQCYWVGAFGKWHYITSRDIPDRHLD